MNDTKRCSRCGQEKPLSAYHKNEYYCKECHKEYMRDWLRGLSTEIKHKIREKHKDSINQRRRSYYYRKTYGMTEEEYKTKKANEKEL